MDKIRFGIIGFGHIGKKHYQYIVANPNAELIAVCDTDLGKAATIKNENLQIFELIETMLAKCEFDVLCVCTPNYLHCEHTIAGLNHNCHIVVEKPMALNSSDCERMIAKAKDKRKKIFTVMQNRYAPSAQWARKLINENELGKVFQIQVNCIWNRNKQYYDQSSWRGSKEKDGGALFTQFSHFVDILYYLHGDMQTYIGGAIGNYNHPYIEIDDSGSFIMISQQNTLINFNYSISAFEKNMESSLTIIAEKGTIKIGGQYLNNIEYFNIENKSILFPTIEPAPANDYGFYQGSMNNHDKVIIGIIDNLLYDKPAISSAEEGKAVVRIIENMYKIAQN